VHSVDQLPFFVTVSFFAHDNFSGSRDVFWVILLLMPLGNYQSVVRRCCNVRRSWVGWKSRLTRRQINGWRRRPRSRGLKNWLGVSSARSANSRKNSLMFSGRRRSHHSASRMWFVVVTYLCIPTVWVKKSPLAACGFLTFFHKRLKILNQFFYTPIIRSYLR